MDISTLQRKLQEVTDQAPKMGHHEEQRFRFLFYDEIVYLLESKMKSNATSWQMSEALGEVLKIIQNEATQVQINWDTIKK